MLIQKLSSLLTYELALSLFDRGVDIVLGKFLEIGSVSFRGFKPESFGPRFFVPGLLWHNVSKPFFSEQANGGKTSAVEWKAYLGLQSQHRPR